MDGPQARDKTVGIRATEEDVARWTEASVRARKTLADFGRSAMDAAASGAQHGDALPDDPEFRQAVAYLLSRLPVGSAPAIVRACVILAARADKEGSGLLGLVPAAPKPGPRK